VGGLEEGTPNFPEAVDRFCADSSEDLLVKEAGPSFCNAHGAHFFLDGLTGKLRVEVAGHEVWSPRRLDLHAAHLLPVDVGEKLVRTDLGPSLGTVVGVFLKEPSNEVLAGI
jgi:hypothetical protein